MSDITAVLANLKDLQARRNGRLDDAGSSLSSVKAMLDNANQLLETARVRRPEARSEGEWPHGRTMSRSAGTLADVRQFASDFRNGRY